MGSQVLHTVMLYFWWGCRRNLKFILRGSERVNPTTREGFQFSSHSTSPRPQTYSANQSPSVRTRHVSLSTSSVSSSYPVPPRVMLAFKWACSADRVGAWVATRDANSLHTSHSSYRTSRAARRRGVPTAAYCNSASNLLSLEGCRNFLATTLARFLFDALALPLWTPLGSISAAIVDRSCDCWRTRREVAASGSPAPEERRDGLPRLRLQHHTNGF